MSKRKKHISQRLWPFVVRSVARKERDAEFAHGCMESRRRFKALTSNVKHSRLSTTVQNLELRWFQTRSEHYENRVDLDFRRIFADLVARARRDSLDVEELVMPFLALHHFKSLYPYNDPKLKALLDVIRQGAIYWDDTPEIRKDNVKRAREWRESLEHTLTDPSDRPVMERFLHVGGVSVVGVDVAAETILDREDRELLCIMDPDLDLELVDAALSGCCEEGPLSQGEIEALASYTRELRRQCRSIDLKNNDYWDKLRLALEYVACPTDILDDDNAEGHAFLELLAGFHRCILTEHIIGSGQPKQLKSRLHMLDDTETIWDAVAGDEVFLAVLCRRPETWYVILQQILAQNGAVDGESLRPWALPLLSNMIQHPAKLKKLRVPDHAARTRSALARYVAPLLTGVHFEEERVMYGEATLANAEARHALNVVAERVVLSVTKSGLEDEVDSNDDGHEDSLLGFECSDKRKAAAKAVATFIAPNFDAILVRFCEDILGEPEEVPSPEELAGMYPDLNIEVEEEETPERPAAAEEVTVWYYVDRPDLDTQRHSLKLKPGERDRALGKFFRKHGIDTVIKPESIAGALDHFCAMPETVRHVAPKEQIGANSWVKLKRGKMRILAREDEDGRLLFHVYQRKVWSSDMFDKDSGAI